jgi:hypothetical protein
MQLDTSLAKKIVHDILKKNGVKTTDKRLMHPVREWFVGLSVALLILGFSINESVKFYLIYDNIDATSRQVADTTLIYRSAEVSEALLLLETKATKNRSGLYTAPLSTLLPQAEPATSTPALNLDNAPYDAVDTNIDNPVVETDLEVTE